MIILYHYLDILNYPLLSKQMVIFTFIPVIIDPENSFISLQNIPSHLHLSLFIFVAALSSSRGAPSAFPSHQFLLGSTEYC